jgi:hypothetical protein
MNSSEATVTYTGLDGLAARRAYCRVTYLDHYVWCPPSG